MAGTPTPNYQFPTYAETDTPNLAGAYNQAVNAIDAKIKEVADTISSGANVPDANSTTKGIAKLYDSATVGAGDQDDGGITPKAVDDKIDGSLTGYAPKFTAAAPITYSGNQIGVNVSSPAQDGSTSGSGVVTVTGKQADITAADALNTGVVPNVKAVKDYVDAKVPTEQQAYTGTAPITVDVEGRTIGINDAMIVSSDNVADFLSAMQGNSLAYKNYVGSVYPIADATAYSELVSNHDVGHNWPAGRTVPNVACLMGAISSIPTATTSTKGLVQLTPFLNPTQVDKALTAESFRFASGKYDSSSRALTVADLSRLKVNTTTGLVYLNIPDSE